MLYVCLLFRGKERTVLKIDICPALHYLFGRLLTFNEEKREKEHVLSLEIRWSIVRIKHVSKFDDILKDGVDIAKLLTGIKRSLQWY